MTQAMAHDLQELTATNFLDLPILLVNRGALALVFAAAGLHPSSDRRGRGPKAPHSPASWLRESGFAAGKAWGSRLEGSSECEQCLSLPAWPQPAPPGAPRCVCGPGLQGLINSGWAQGFEIAG